MLTLSSENNPEDRALEDHPNRTFWYLLAILLLGLILRLIRLDTVLWGDEVATWAFARRHPLVEMLVYSLHDPTPPLYYILMHFIIPLLGASIVMLRLPSVLLGVALIPVVYWSMRQASFNKIDALVATLLAAMSSVLIYYSQEARAYALLAFLGTLSVGMLYYRFRNPGWCNDLLYGLVLLLLVTTSYYGLALAAAEMICLVIYRVWKTLFAGMVALALTGGLIAYQSLANSFAWGAAGRAIDLNAILSFLNTLTIGTIGMRTLTVMANGQLLAFPIEPFNTILAIVGFFLYMGIVFVGVRSYRRLQAEQRKSLIVLLACIAIPVGLALLAGSPLSPRPQWLLRGLIFIWPLFLMATVISLKFSRWRPAFVLGILALNAFSLYPYYTTYIRWLDQPMFDTLNQITTADDLIVSDPWYMYNVIDYYYDGPAPMVGSYGEEGWLDAIAMTKSNRYEPIRLKETPHPKNNIYVYYRRGGLKWLDSFPNNRVFTFDDQRRVWREIDPASGEWK
ncbi:MAG: hypothetical protein A2W35_02125 [Chloroflexi bacterium RBG_16_57_11]|nr:MAG: hypothetical protein A2W35_02125 [Chloroflexi bacterium RBG_16_57_11]